MVEKLKDIIIACQLWKKISKLSKNGCNDALLNYICENHDEMRLNVN